VYREVIFFGSASKRLVQSSAIVWGIVPSKREGVPLEVRDLRAGQEDILSSPHGGFFLLDLQLHNVGRVLDHLGDKRNVPRPDLPQDAFTNPNDSAY
jgi:hypothetical protein